MTSGALNYQIETAQLDNGMRVAVAPDSLAPGVAVNIWVNVGSADEVVGKTGFAHLFEHLMFQGSANLESGEHIALVESLGGSVNATTSTDRTNYFETVPRGALELALWMEADRFSSLAITAENFENQRQVVKEEKRQRYDNQPYGDVWELLTGLHFAPDHPYGHTTIGSMADLDAASLDDVAGFFTQWYPASNLSLVLCGAISPQEGFELAAQYFGKLPSTSQPQRSAMPERQDPASRLVHVRRAVPHSIEYLSWPTPPAHHADQLALDLALAILSDGHSSRLHRELVKNSQRAREVSGISITNRSAASAAILTARVGESDLDSLRSAVLDQVAQFCASGPSDEEFERAVAQYEHQWLAELSTTSARADALNEAWQIYGTPESINQRLSEVLSLTPEDVRRTAERYLTPDDVRELRYEAGEDQ